MSTRAGGVATTGDALDSNKQYGYTKFEGSETALVAVNSVVAREDWQRAPYSLGHAADLWRLVNAVVNPTRKVRSSQQCQSRLKPVERAGKTNSSSARLR